MVLVGAGGDVVVLLVFVVLFAMLCFPFGVRFGVRVRGVVPSREGGLG